MIRETTMSTRVLSVLSTIILAMTLQFGTAQAAPLLAGSRSTEQAGTLLQHVQHWGHHHHRRHHHHGWRHHHHGWGHHHHHWRPRHHHHWGHHHHGWGHHHHHHHRRHHHHF
ncbi:hypothetical protein BV511_06595 [Methylorubrum extorquens]|nr:hypothetical protein BV511_06595 [Methylorubrum extorquens]